MERHNESREDVSRVAVVSDEWEPLEPLLAFLRGQPRIAVVQTFEEDSLPAELAAYRGIFMYVHRTLQTGTARKLIDYTQAGGRMIILHHGIASSKVHNPDWLGFVGIHIAPRDNPDKPWRVIADTTHTFVNLCPGHYITSHGIEYNEEQPFRASPDGPETALPALRFSETEVFVNQQHAEGRNKTVLFGSHCVDPDSGEVISQIGTGWLEPSGAGWVFYFQPGHRAEDFQHTLYRQILMNCLTVGTPLER